MSHTYPQHWLYSTNTCTTFTLVDLWKGKGIESDTTGISNKRKNLNWLVLLCLVVASSEFSSDTWRSFSIFNCSRLLAISATYMQVNREDRISFVEKKSAKLFSRKRGQCHVKSSMKVTGWWAVLLLPIRIRLSEVQIRIRFPLSSSKNSKKNLDS